MLFSRFKRELPAQDDALAGRTERPYPVPARHAVLGNPLEGPYPEHLEVADFALGCFCAAGEADLVQRLHLAVALQLLLVLRLRQLHHVVHACPLALATQHALIFPYRARVRR